MDRHPIARNVKTVSEWGRISLADGQEIARHRTHRWLLLTFSVQSIYRIVARGSVSNWRKDLTDLFGV